MRELFSSLVPRPRSIFTLRPVYNTDQPPSVQARTAPPNGARRRWVAALLLGAVSAAALATLWAYGRGGRNHDAPALVLVNGKCKAKQTPTGEFERWDAQALTIHLDSSLTSLGPGGQEAVEAAFATWLESGAKLPGLRFEIAANLSSDLAQDGKSSVSFAPIELPGHENDLAITIGYADADTGRIIESDVILNSKRHYAVLGHDAAIAGQDEHEGCGAYDIQDVATHEVGHFFGLGEDYADANATMFHKTGKCELKKRDLELTDREVVTELYRDELAAKDGETGCAATIAGRTKPTSGGIWLALPLVLMIGTRRITEAQRGRNDE